MRRRTQNTAGMQMHVAFGCETNLNSSICVHLRMLNICIAAMAEGERRCVSLFFGSVWVLAQLNCIILCVTVAVTP